MAQGEFLENKQKNHGYSKGRILVVEDDRTFRAVIGMQLEEMDYDVVEAVNGQQAFEILSAPEEVFDIILLDREMPLINGMQLIRHMQSQPNMRHIPVIMITVVNPHFEVQV